MVAARVLAGLESETAVRTFACDLLGQLKTLLAMAGLGWAAWHARREPLPGAVVGWTLLTLGALAWAVGDLLWLMIALHGGQPWEASPDWCFLLFYPLFLAGVLCFPRSGRKRDTAIFLDLGVVMLAAISVLWTLVVAPLGQQQQGAAAVKLSTMAIAIGYPVGDLLLLWAALEMTILGRGAASAWAGRLLAGGAAVLVVTDTIYGRQLLAGTYASGNYLGIFWTIGLGLLGLAGARSATRAAGQVRQGDDAGRSQAFSLVLAACCIAAAWVVSSIGHGEPALDFTDVALGAILVLVGIRQALILVRNRTLATNLRQANDVLEQRVEERTHSLRIEVAERRAAEEALRISQDTARQLFESDIVGIIAWQADGRVTNANAHFLAMLGLERRDLENGQINWRHLTPIEHLTQDEIALEKLNAGQVLLPFEKEYLHRDGHRVPVLLGGVRRGLNHGVAFVLDLSDRRRLEERLRQAEKLEALGRLAGGVAHDFNNLLTAILGAAELLIHRLPVDDERRVQAQMIATAAIRAADHARTLLAFSRKQAITTRPVDLHALMDETCAMLARGLDPRIVICQRRVADRPVVMGDASQLANALLNLAINARDAMPDGGTLTLTSDEVTLAASQQVNGRTLPAGRWWRITVGDTGIGMDASVQSQLFDPFFTTKEIGRGTGLGLPSVQATIVAHEGAIEVRSQPGHGSEFILWLARHDRPVDPDATPAPDQQTVPLGGTVLVVEDEEVVRLLLTEILQERGWTVLVAGDGGEGMALFEREHHRLDAVLLDLMLPVIDGRTCLARMHALNSKVPVIITSGFPGSEDMGLTRAPFGYLAKPWHDQDLYQLLDRARRVRRRSS